MIGRKVKSALCTLASLFLIVAASIGQEVKTRIANDMKAYPNQPVTVVGKEVGSRAFVDNRLAANQYWLKDLSIEFQNTSQKTITYMLVNLYIEKQANMKAAVVVPIQYHSGLNAESKYGLSPGQTVKLKIEDQNYDLAMKQLVSAGVHDVSGIKIDVRRITFADGKRWFVGFEVEERIAPGQPSLIGKSPLLSFFLPEDFSHSL